MKNIIVTIISVIFFYGCGGGSGSNSNQKQHKPVIIKNIDISNAHEVKLTKKNALEYLELSRMYIPEDLRLTRYEYVKLLKKSFNNKTKCEYGGYIQISTNTYENKIVFNFDKCKEVNTDSIDGEINIYIDNTSVGETVDYFSAKDLTYDDGHEPIKINYNIMLKSYTDVLKEWKYFVNVESINYHESFQYNMNIKVDKKNITLASTYLLDDNSYFTIKSENIPSIGLPLYGISSENFYKKLLIGYRTNRTSKIILQGENSKLIYRELNDKSLYKLVFDEKNDEKVFSTNLNKKWIDDIHEILPNNSEAHLIINLNNKSLDPNYTTKNYLVDFNKNSNLNIEVSDYGDEYDEYDVYVKLIDKPYNSKLKLDKKKVELEDIVESDNFSDIRKKGTYINHFDVDGIYTFEISIREGEVVKKEKVKIEFYDSNKLNSSFKTLSHNVLNTFYLKDINKMVFLSSKPDNKLIFDDLNKTIIEFDLPITPKHMAFSSDKKRVYISARNKILKINIENMESIYLEKEYKLPAEIADIEIFNNYAYVLEHRDGWVKLFSLNLDSEVYSSTEYASSGLKAKILLNSKLQSLYILDDGLSPQDIRKFDISQGQAKKLYDSPYHGDYNFLDNIWALDSNKIIAASGNIFTMNDIKATDLLYDGKIEYINNLEYISAFDRSKNHNQYLITKSLNKSLGSYSSFYDSFEYGVNELQIFSSDSDQLVSSYVLKKFYIDDENNIRRLFINNTKYISDSKIFILYESYSKQNDYIDTDSKKYLYEIKSI